MPKRRLPVDIEPAQRLADCRRSAADKWDKLVGLRPIRAPARKELDSAGLLPKLIIRCQQAHPIDWSNTTWRAPETLPESKGKEDHKAGADLCRQGLNAGFCGILHGRRGLGRLASFSRHRRLAPLAVPASEPDA